MTALNPSGYSSPGSSPQGGAGASGDTGKGYSVTKLRRQYLDYETTKIPEIEEQRIARHYYHADQWTSEEVAILKARGQPVVTNNLIGRKIDGTVGLIERLRQDPKAFARKPMPSQPQGQPVGQQGNQGSPLPEGADIATEALRYVMDAQDWQQISSNAARDGAINGLGGLELSIETGDHGDPDVGLAIVDPDTFFYDPRSRRFDFSDARFQGVAKWIDLELAQEMFPDQADMLEGLVDNTSDSLSQQQADNRLFAVNSTLRRVFLIEHWYLKGGQWYFCFYVGYTELMSGKSPFVDEKGKSFCRYFMYCVNVDHDGDRYGLVRNLKPLQDEVNHRRSKAQHVLNTRRIIMQTGAVQDVEKVRKEAVRPDGVIEVNPGDKIFRFDDEARLADLTGQVAALEEAKGQIENFGPTRSLIGDSGGDQSGRAIQLLQQAGIAELGPFILAYRGWKIRVYRAVWNAIQRNWTSERWLRVADDDGQNFVPLNHLQMDQYGQPKIVNHLGSLDVDIILDEGPDTTTLMQDTLEALQALAQNGTQIPPEVIIELANLPLPTKKKIIGLINQPNPMAQVAQAQAGANVQKTVAEIAEIKTKAAANVHNVLHEVASTGMGEGGPAPAPPPVQKPAESIAFKDLPPEGQSQMALQAGIRLTPESLAAHATQLAEQQAALKAASKPKPQGQSVGA